MRGELGIANLMGQEGQLTCTCLSVRVCQLLRTIVIVNAPNSRWQYEPQDGDPEVGKGGDKGLLKAIDALVDAILTP